MVQPPTKKAKTCSSPGAAAQEAPAAAVPEVPAPAQEAVAAGGAAATDAWVGSFWQSGNRPEAKRHTMLQFLILNFKEDISRCLSNCYADLDSVQCTNHKEELQNLPGKLRVADLPEGIAGRMVRKDDKTNEPGGIALDRTFVEAFEAYLALQVEGLDEAEIESKNLHKDEGVIKFLALGKETLQHEIAHLKYHFDGFKDDMKNIQGDDLEGDVDTPERLGYEAGYAFDEQLRRDLLGEEPEDLGGNEDAKVLAATKPTWKHNFTGRLELRYDYLVHAPEDVEDRVVKEICPKVLNADEILEHMDYFGKGRLERGRCPAERPEDWSFHPPTDSSGGGDLGGGGGPGGGGPSGGGPSGGGGGGDVANLWQESIRQLLPRAMHSAKKARQEIIDAQTETSAEGTDPLEMIGTRNRVRTAKRKYVAEDNKDEVHKCSFKITLCNRERKEKKSFDDGEDVCVKLNVTNPTDSDILVGIRHYGLGGEQSFFGRLGVRVEIDECESGRCGDRALFNLNLKAGSSYTFFRTLIRGVEGGGDYAYRRHAPLKARMYTARLWVFKKKSDEAISFLYGR